MTSKPSAKIPSPLSAQSQNISVDDPLDKRTSMAPRTHMASSKPRPTLKDGLTPIVDELVRRGITLAQARREFERQLIEASIRSNQGNLGRAARSLGVHRNTLRNKVTDLGIKPREIVAKTLGPGH